MYNPSLVQIGDILLYRPRDFVGKAIALMTLGKYSHSSLLVSPGRIIESHLDNTDDDGNKVSGVVEKNLNEKWYNVIDVYRVSGGLNFAQKNILVKEARAHVGKKYDLWAFPSAFIRSTIGLLINFKWFRRAKPLFNSSSAEFCSELIARVYEDARLVEYLKYKKGIDICPNVNPMSCTPSDLGRSKALQKIS